MKTLLFILTLVGCTLIYGCSESKSSKVQTPINQQQNDGHISADKNDAQIITVNNFNTESVKIAASKVEDNSIEDRISWIRKEYGRIEANRNASVYDSANVYMDNSSGKAYFEDKSNVECVKYYSAADGYESYHYYYLHNNELFFYFERSWQGTRFPTEEELAEMGLTVNAAHASGAAYDAKESMQEERRVYFENGEPIRTLVKKEHYEGYGNFDGLGHLPNDEIEPSHEDSELPAEVAMLLEDI